MKILDYSDKTITVDEFVQLINTTRKANKNNWYAFVGNVDGKPVVVKGIDTWLQRFLVDSLYQPGPMEISVKQFIENLRKPFN